MRAHRPARSTTRSTALVPRRVGGPRAHPDRRRRAARRQPRRRHPVRRPGRSCTASRPSSAGPSTAWPTTSSAAAGRRHAVVARRRRASPTPTTRTGCSASRSSSCSSSPRARKGTGKTYAERYQLRRFGRGGFVRDRHAGRRADRPDRRRRRRGVDADPLEEPPLAKLLGLPYFPITANMLAFGPLGPRAARLLPGQVQAPGARPGPLRRRARPGALLAQPDHGRVRAHPRSASRTRSSTCSARRESSGSAEARMGKRVLVTGLGTFWGGRVAQALEADPDVDVIVGLDRSSPTVQLERTEFVRTDANYSILARIVKATQVDTIVHTFLVVDSTQMRSQPMHEINVIGTMNLFAAASAPGSHRPQRRREVVDARLRRRPARTPTGSARSHAARSPPRSTGRAQPPRGRGLRARLRRRQPARDRSRCCASPTCSAPTSPRRSPRRSSCRSCRRSSASTPASSSSTRTTSSARSSSRSTTQLPGIYNVAGDGLLPWSEVAAICGKRTVPAAPARHRACCPAAAPARVLDLPARAARAAPLRARRRQPAPQAGRVPVPLHVRGHGRRLRRGPAAPPTVGRQRARLPVRARRRAVLPPLPRRRPRGLGPPSAGRSSACTSSASSSPTVGSRRMLSGSGRCAWMK